MHALIDRPAADPHRLTPPSAGSTSGSGYRGFHPALDERCALLLAEHLAAAAAGSPRERAVAALTLAGRVVAEHGMPARHAAARQLLAAFPAVYDRFFRLPATWQLTAGPAATQAAGSTLTWVTADGHALVDVLHTAPPSHALVDGSPHQRLAALESWARQAGLRLVAVRLLAMTAPGTSLMQEPSGEFGPLAATPFAGTALTGDQVGGPAAGAAVAR